MERRIITISENGRVDIPSGDVWMSEMELVELFGVIAPTLRAAIRAIYRNSGICPVTTRRCDVATPISWATFYNIEVIIALSFHLGTYEAEKDSAEGAGVCLPTKRKAYQSFHLGK